MHLPALHFISVFFKIVLIGISDTCFVLFLLLGISITSPLFVVTGLSIVSSINIFYNFFTYNVSIPVLCFCGISTSIVGIILFYFLEFRRSLIVNDNPSEISSEYKLLSDDNNEEECKIKRVRQQNIRNEILSSENAYINQLDILFNEYLIPLRSNASSLNVSEENINIICNHLDAIRSFHSTFVLELEKQVNSNYGIVSLFLKYSDFLRVYVDYINKYQDKTTILHNVMSKNRKFANFIDSIYNKTKSNRNNSAFSIESLLIVPVQRIPRYELLLRELRKNIIPHEDNIHVFEEALAKVHKIAQHINEMKRKYDSFQIFCHVQNLPKAGLLFPLFQPSRSVINHSELYTQVDGLPFIGKHSVKKYEVTLFSDAILWIKQTDDKGYYRGHIELSGSSVELLSQNKKNDESIYESNEVNYKSLPGFMVTPRKGKPVTFRASSEELVKKWHDSINTAIRSFEHLKLNLHERTHSRNLSRNM